MPSAREIKKGDVIEVNRRCSIVRSLETKSPSARGAATLYKFRLSTIPDGQKMEISCTGDEQFDEVAIERRSVSLLYREGEQYTFMDSESYEQYTVDQATLRQQLPYLTDGMEGLTALLIEEQLQAVELPASIALEIVDTPPAVKGASASARTKTARLTTGLELQVPEYLSIGEVVRVNTETGKFISRGQS